MLQNLIKVIIISLFVTGCASAIGTLIPNPPAAPPIHCPPLVAYSTLEQSAMSNEISSDGPEAQIFIEDYKKLRDACSGK